MLPKHSKDSSPGRLAVSQGHISGLRVWRDKVGHACITGYVMASTSQLYYWAEIKFHDEDDEYQAVCACKTKYVPQIVTPFFELFLTSSRMPCHHVAALLFAALLVKEHLDDETCPVWARAPRTDNAKLKKDGKAESSCEWPSKLINMFAPLRDNVEFRGQPGMFS